MESQKNKSGYILLIVVLVLGFVAYSMWRPSPAAENAAKNLMESVKPLEESTSTKDSDSMMKKEDTTKDDTSMMVDPKAKVFTVTANNFAYDIKEIMVQKGDTVTINFKNSEGFHDWIIDEFDAATKQLTAGQSESITFVADEAGTFEYYCSVGKHRAMGMVGKLIVK